MENGGGMTKEFCDCCGKELVKGENKVRDALRSGAGVTETFAKYGIL